MRHTSLKLRWVLPVSAETRKFKGWKEMKGGNGRDPTLKNMSELMPAE